MLTTPLCEALGVEHPVWCAAMGGGIAGPRLVAAVANAGGFGFLGLIGLLPSDISAQIDRTRALTSRPFGVNLVVPCLRGGEIDVCLDARPAVLGLFWGDPRPFVGDAHRRGIKVMVQVGSVDEAIAAADAGVDAVIAQGVEAGGHVHGTTSLAVLLPAVVRAVRPLPVVAAGGIADGSGLAAALVLGAQAAAMGTRFLASEEAHASPAYKHRIVAARAEDTVLTSLFDVGWPDAPHRVLRTRVYDTWEAAGRPASGHRPDEGTSVGSVTIGSVPVQVPRYAAIPPLPGFEGDVDDFCLYAGQSSTLVADVRPAATIVAETVRDARKYLDAAVDHAAR
jgi:NAD(P)H-dependent flavin oxidoreductase YrpB (nitropropane dioxygenase family)